MATVNLSTDINISAEELWQLIGGFNALPDWHPAVEKSELQNEGNQRTLSLVGGGSIVETLERLDDNERVYSYEIIDSPFPVANYKSSLKVTENDDGKASVEWSSEFDADGAPEQDAIDVIQGVYQAGFDNLKKMYGG